MPLDQIRSRLGPIVLDIAVFICGAVVMVYEIIGSRILAPYIGTSTYVWTSLIGIILGSLSLGYWLGGRLADRRPDIKILSAAIFVAGGLVSVTVLIKDIFSSFVSAMAISIELKAVVAALVLFAPASVCLGIVTPYAVRLKLADVADSGRTVGRLYALSTVGSILGTFAAGFFLIPFVGSIRTLYLIAGSLFFISVVLAPFRLSQTSVAAITVFVIGVIASEADALILRKASELVDIDTEYSRVRIFRAIDPVTQKPIRALATDPYITQSAVFLDSDDLVLPHNRFYHLIRYYKPDFKNVLMIGGAGYTFPRDYLAKYADARITVVEIDPRMTSLAREYFRLKDDSRLSVVHEDGRAYLNHSPDGQFDAVLMDAFSSLFTAPFHLTTLEAARQVSRTLNPDGVAILNMGSSVSGDASKFLQAELATYREVFPSVEVFKVHLEYPDEKLQNVIIVASKRRLAGAENIDPEIDALLQHRVRIDPAATIAPLIDDLAPVEYYNSIAQDRYLSQH